MPTTVKNIYIVNASSSASGGGAITGLPDSPVTNMLFQDCDLTCGTPVRLTNTANLDTAGLKITLPNGGPDFTNGSANGGSKARPKGPGTKKQP